MPARGTVRVLDRYGGSQWARQPGESGTRASVGRGGGVVASRWNVDTESGAQFMDWFYNELLSGEDERRSASREAPSGRQRHQPPLFLGGIPELWDSLEL